MSALPQLRKKSRPIKDLQLSATSRRMRCSKMRRRIAGFNSMTSSARASINGRTARLLRADRPHGCSGALINSTIDANPLSICHVNADANSPATTAAPTFHDEFNQHRSHHNVPHLAPCHMLLAGVPASAARLRNCEPPAAALASRARLKRKMPASSVALRASARILPPSGRHQSRAPTAGTTSVKNTPPASRPQPIHFGPSAEPGNSFNLCTTFT